MSQERNELIKKLIKEFDVRTVKDAESVLKDMFTPMLQSMLEAELDNHLGYERYERTGDVSGNTRNGHSKKTVTTSFGEPPGTGTGNPSLWL